jgi:hypothetical protein
MTAIATSGLDGGGLDRSRQMAPSGRSGLLAVGLVAVGLWLTSWFAVAGDALHVTNARVPASDEIAMRAVKSIPIPENKTIELKRDGHHVMLLQARQKLVDG